MRFLPLAALVFLAACQPAAPPELTDADKAEVEQAITDLWAAFELAIMSRDVEEYLPFWTQDARILEPGMDMGGSELRDFFGEFWGSGGEVFTFALESYEIFVHGDVAYQIGQYDESFQFPGAEPAEAHNYFFMRFEKNADGIWQIDRLVAGPREAPAEG